MLGCITSLDKSWKIEIKQSILDNDKSLRGKHIEKKMWEIYKYMEIKQYTLYFYFYFRVRERAYEWGRGAKGKRES